MPELLEIATADDDGIMRALATPGRAVGAGARGALPALVPAIAPPARPGRDGGDRERARAASASTELLEYLAAHSREPTLQKKAGIVLEQMAGRAAGDS